MRIASHLLLALLAALCGVAFASVAPPRPLEGTDLLRGAPLAIDLASAPVATAVVFLSARCPCSASHEETLKKLAAEFPKVRFVAVHSNADESVEESRAHFAAANLPFPVLQDAGARIADLLGAFKTPHVFVFDPHGEILFQGGVDDSHIAATASRHYLEDALKAVREGKKPEIAQARALGCVIQRP